MGNVDLEKRTKEFALDIIKFYTKLPKNDICQVMGKQLLKFGTSVGANYREAMHARSKAEFVSKLGIVEQELSETIYWLELFESIINNSNKIDRLRKEAKELLAIIIASIRTSRRNT